MAAKYYSYEPLDEPTDARLLELEAGKDGEPIACTLIHISLQNLLHSYSALSYTWGNAHDRSEIICNGKKLFVTANLHSSLRRIRHQDKSCMLWTDAICINQSDIAERESQVRNMKIIYQQASEVIADVGDWTEEHQLAFVLASKAIGVFQDLDSSIIISESDFEKYGLPPSYHKEWKAWTSFLGRSWFRRIWVIQEFALASNVRMLCGDTFFTWEALFYTMSQLIHHGMGENQRSIFDGYEERMAASRGCLGIINLARARQAVEENKPRKLLTLLQHSRSCEASDARDKIYALLGLSEDANEPSIQISYSEPASHLLERVARILILTDSGVEVLYEAGGYKKLQDLPSWSPDWTCRKEESQLGDLRNSDDDLIYHASGSSSFKARFMEDRKKLAVTGCIVDEIQIVGTAFFRNIEGSYVTDEIIWDKMHAFEKEASGLTSNATSYPSGESVFDAYWRTLIGNKTHHEAEAEAPAEYGEFFAALLRVQQIYEESKRLPQSRGPFFASSLASENEAQEFKRLEDKSRPYRLSQQVMLPGRRFGMTKKGFFGMLTQNAEKGDYICIVMGSTVPLIVREIEVAQSLLTTYSIVGEGYIHGMMNGEALMMEGFEVTDIILQ